MARGRGLCLCLYGLGYYSGYGGRDCPCCSPREANQAEMDQRLKERRGCGMREIDIAWLAGYLEGEGCFSSHYTCYCELQVSSTDKDVIDKVAGLIGAPVHTHKKRLLNPHWKQQWITRLGGRRAVEIMKIILPYMGERRRLKMEELINAYGRKLPVDPNALAEEVMASEGNKDTRAKSPDNATIRN